MIFRPAVATAYLRSMQAGVRFLRKASPELYRFVFRNDDSFDQEETPLPYHLPGGARWLGEYRYPARGTRECVIIGKGPSVNRLAPGILRNRLVCCVNDAYRLVAGPSFVFFHDTMAARHFATLSGTGKTLILPHLLSHHGRFRPTAHLLAAYGNGPLPPVLFYEKKELYTVPFAVSWTNFLMENPNTLYALSGTVHSAIAFAWRMEVKKIFFIGFDGTTRRGRLYGDGFPYAVPSLWHRVAYRKIRWDARVLTFALGMSGVFLDARPG